jgi:hypothetical protein
VAYFRDALGFEVMSIAPRDPKMILGITNVPGSGVLIGYVRGPGHSIELIEYRGPSNRIHLRPRPCDVGFAHIAYDVENVDDAIAAGAPHGVVPPGAARVEHRVANRGGHFRVLRTNPVRLPLVPLNADA